MHLCNNTLKQLVIGHLGCRCRFQRIDRRAVVSSWEADFQSESSSLPSIFGTWAVRAITDCNGLTAANRYRGLSEATSPGSPTCPPPRPPGQ